MKTATLLALAGLAGIPGGHDPCEDEARALLQSAQDQADADYYLILARCINDPEGPFTQCVDEAQDARDEALELAEDQFDARLKVCAQLGGGRYNPVILPADYTSDVTNNYNPLVVDRTLVYEKSSPEGLEHTEVTTLDKTVVVNGVECRAVHDVVSLDGVVVEDTEDWFAQSVAGDVWYFGEISYSYVDGFVDNIGGSWRYGTDGGKPGIQMLASPGIGDFYRQEYLIGTAEDVARVVSLDETVVVSYGTFTHCIKTLEGTAIDPEAIEAKFYAPGIGLVLETEGGERVELVDIR